MAGNFVNQPVAKTINFKIHGKLTNSNYIMNNSFVIGNHSKINSVQRKFISNTIKEFIVQKIN